MELYSAPTLNISNCVTIKLTERNYLLWKTQFESFLSGQNLLGFVNGSYEAPSQVISVPGIGGKASEVTNPDYPLWLRSDHVVRAWILGSLSEDILAEVVNTTTSQQLWLALAFHFNQVSNSKLFELQRRFQNTKKKEATMSS
ncbi:Retrovirus-related Pol polyprotein from transposon RE1 [Cardamine amara subsp. amara]|uniref:Retrovirus-related Pol polyprotein from transposon RE1 n=1 Tax=Cardamine amara subsp. amara TaxID=228776 RepID=A0ABD0ZYT3_CARAN